MKSWNDEDSLQFWRAMLQNQLLARYWRLRGEDEIADLLEKMRGTAREAPAIVREENRRRLFAALEVVKAKRAGESSRTTKGDSVVGPRHVHEEYDDTCPDCRPQLLDPRTGHVLGEHDPSVQMLRRAWPKIPLSTKRLYFRFTIRGECTEETITAMNEIQSYFDRERLS